MLLTESSYFIVLYTDASLSRWFFDTDNQRVTCFLFTCFHRFENTYNWQPSPIKISNDHKTPYELDTLKAKTVLHRHPKPRGCRRRVLRPNPNNISRNSCSFAAATCSATLNCVIGNPSTAASSTRGRNRWWFDLIFWLSPSVFGFGLGLPREREGREL